MIATLSWIAAGAAVVFGFLVFRLESMARVTFALLASVLCVAVEVVLVGLSYLGVVLVLMTVMEMVVMAVFMVMYMMNPAGLMPMSMVHNRRGALGVSAGTFVVLTVGIVVVDWPRGGGPAAGDPTTALGSELMGSSMPTMMVLGLVLFATIVATVVLATGRGRYDRFGDELRAERPDDPVPGGVAR